MAYVTKGMKDRAEDARNWERNCSCGHPVPEHFNLPRDVWTMDHNGDWAEVPNPKYDPNQWHCRVCGCIKTTAEMRSVR
jgi:hypothetical protein